MMRPVISFFITIITSSLWALAVDEKLPLRFLKVSDTKKTVLINRGVEDGLILGDHARFFLTTGVVARGVLVKLSPSRSVWSLYRLINPEEIVEEQVMNLKITPPIKLDFDPTKMFTDQDIPKPPEEGITLTEKGEELEANLTEEERRELHRLKSSLQEGAYYPHISDSTIELWSLFHMASMNSTSSLGGDSEGTKGKNQFFSFLVGLEKYFEGQKNWYSALSLFPFFQYEIQEASNLEGHRLGSQVMAYGGGVNYHFINSPLYVGGIILMVGASGGLGRTQDRAVFTHNVKNNESDIYKGDCTFFSAGGGFKYYFAQGFGVRGVIDYYRRSEKYKIEESNDNYSKVVSGPRFLLGLSYRW